MKITGVKMREFPQSRGFTMIELAVAILVFCIGFVGINKLHGMAVRGNAYSMQLTEATNVMKSMAEWLEGLPDTSASLGGSSAVTGTLSFSLSPVKTATTTYTRSFSVNQVSGSTLKKVIVTVRWAETGIRHDVSVTFCR
jgi:prepilin-type N-terminal cleavage/methylation domain-containing protein